MLGQVAGSASVWKCKQRVLCTTLGGVRFWYLRALAFLLKVVVPKWTLDVSCCWNAHSNQAVIFGSYLIFCASVLCSQRMQPALTYPHTQSNCVEGDWETWYPSKNWAYSFVVVSILEGGRGVPMQATIERSRMDKTRPFMSEKKSVGLVMMFPC